MDVIRFNTARPLYEPLTDREREILACLAIGLSNKEIARQLHLALRTVKWYNSQIYGKLQVRNRREAVAVAVALGLVQSAGKQADATPSHHLPVELIPFIGRRCELNELSHLLEQDDTRLITIQGAGGMGKTRLAVALARQQLHHYPDGAHFVALAPLHAAEDIVLETAGTLGCVFSGSGSAKAQLLRFLRDKHLLLVMDNFEHLIDGAPLMTEILKAAPQVKIIVTSREKLRVQGEISFPIGGMDVPAQPSADNILDYDAAALFVDAMRRTNPAIDVTQTDNAAVVQICRLVGGMPLAILLAAAWLDVLSLDEIVDEINGSFDLLTAELQDVPQRHHSIRTVFDHTWNRLTLEQQAVFMNVSVFRGGWTREAAQEVAGTSLPDSQTLVNKSLIWRLPNGRYEIHELLRQYAAEKLRDTGTADDVHDKHRRYYLELLHRHEPDIKSRRQLEVLDAIDADRENIFTAWRWGIERDAAEAIGRGVETLLVYCTTRTREREVEALLRQAKEHFTAEAYPREWGRITVRRARLMMVGAFERTGSFYDDVERCLAIAEEYGDAGEIVFCKVMLAYLLNLVDKPRDIESAITWTHEALAYYERIGDPYYSSLTLKWMSYMWYRSDEDLRLSLLERSLAVAREAGIANLIAWTVGELGNAYFDLGRYADSERAYQDCHEVLPALRDFKTWVVCLNGLSLAEFFSGKFASAREHCETSFRMADQFGLGSLKVVGLSVLALLQTLEQETFAEAKKLAIQATRINVFHPTEPLLALAARMIAVYALGDEQTAWRETPQRLRDGLAETSLPISITALMVMALLVADAGQHNRAVELLGLALSHPASPRGWLENWPLLTRKREQLHAELGTDAYVAAWERGRGMDMVKLIEQLLSEYGDVMARV